MDYKVLKRIVGLIVFIFATVVYVMTVQPTLSFWDCGEFIACAYTLSTPHPPGAPLHILVGKIFTMLPTASDIGLRMNYLSAISSSLTVLLLFLVSAKLMKNFRGTPKNLWDSILILVPSSIGALVLAFSDSFWFNAMEAEVYGFGTFLIALTIYLLVHWWEHADEPNSDRYLILVAYIVGLSIGIHLLVVQCIFLAGLIFYFRRYEFSLKSLGIAIVASMFGFFIVYPGIVKKFPSAIENFPEVGGIITVIALVILVYIAEANNIKPLKIVALSLFLIVIGYSTYISVLQRSAVPNLPIDENNPDNMERLLSYLNREQYGEQPLFLPRRYSRDPMHQRTWDKYSSDMDFMWRYQINHMFNRYLFWQFIGREGYDQDMGVGWNVSEPIKFVTIIALGILLLLAFRNFTENKYKLALIFLVLFFAVGISSFSSTRLLGIPFLFGLWGVFYHFKKDWKLAFVFLLMFVMMGVVTALYQNQQDPQPRERDYFYIGAFYVYSLWAGLGVLGLLEVIRNAISETGSKISFAPIATIVLLVSFIGSPVLMLATTYRYQSRADNYFPFDYAYNLLQSVDKDAILITNGDNDTFPLWCLQAVYGVRTDVRIVNLSLGQTDWYILQLKNERPYGAKTVPFTMTDAQIKELTLNWIDRRWDENKPVVVDVPPTAYPDTMKTKPDKLVFKVPATFKYNRGGQNFPALKVNDYVVLDIIRANHWERPIYFSVTVSPDNYVGLLNNLILEGMAYRLVPYQASEIGGGGISEEKMKKNLFVYNNVVPSKEPQGGFIFRGLSNSKIFYDENHMRMIEMYRRLYLRLADYFMEDSTKTNLARETLDYMEKNISRDVAKMDYRQKYELAKIYYALGDMQTFNQYADEVYADAYKEREPYKMSGLDKYYNPYRILIDVAEMKGDYRKALDLLKELNQNDPNVRLKMESINARLSGQK